MSHNLPETLWTALEQRQGPAVLTTLSADNRVNSVYVTLVKRIGDTHVAIVDCAFAKTRANLATNHWASLLYITKDNKAYQLKGPIAYQDDPETIAQAAQWIPSHFTARGVALLRVEEAFSGATELFKAS